MVTLIYIDTDVFLNFLLDRKNEYGKPLGPEAEELFNKVFFYDFEIVISTKVLEELYGELQDPGQAQMLINMLQTKKKLKIVKYTPDELEEANKLDRENRNDALHALLAKKHGAKYIITRNMRHFKNFSHIIEPKFPKDI